MAYRDDYRAKIEIWARESRVYPLPTATGLPRFGHRKFSSYAEMNAWKRDLIRRLAAAGGCGWTS